MSSLPVRQEQVLWLRYGLDGCTYTQEEVAHLLGLSRNTIYATEQCALQNLRTSRLSLGQRSTRSLALKGNKNACHRTEAGIQKIEQQRQEREGRLWTAYRQLQAQDIPVTRDALCRAAHTDNRAVAEFLRQRRYEEPPSQKVPSVEERLHRAYTELESNGEKPTIKRLRQLAHVQSDVASTFLRSLGVPLKLGRPKKSKQRLEWKRFST